MRNYDNIKYDNLLIIFPIINWYDGCGGLIII